MAARLPRLVAVYGHRSHDLLALRAGAKGCCELVWLIDRTDPSATAMRPLLERSGAVVDCLGSPAEEVAAALAPHAPGGLATFYDTGMEHVAEIARRLGVRFNSPATGRALEDKLEQRRMLAAAGLPTPRVRGLAPHAGAAEVARAGAEVGFPAVLKPRRASGSWQTFVVADAGELAAVWADLERERPEPRLIESYLTDGPALPGGFEADYVSVETVAVDGALHHLALTGRFPVVHPLRETGFFIPSTLAPATARDVVAVAAAALEAVRFEHGCAHTEVKLTADGPRVIEINGRIGGGVPDMLRLATGLDIVRMTMQAALGEPPDGRELPPAQRVGYRFFHQPPAGARRVVAVDGLDRVLRLPGIESARLHRPPGTAIDVREGTRSYVFAVVGSTADWPGLLEIERRIREEVAIAYDGGEVDGG